MHIIDLAGTAHPKSCTIWPLEPVPSEVGKNGKDDLLMKSLFRARLCSEVQKPRLFQFFFKNFVATIDAIDESLGQASVA